jgi:hypothetical protein
MEGFGGTIRWEHYKNDNIIPLLYHSDCDGELTVEECDQIIPRLKELVNILPEEDYDKIKGLKLIESMEEAVENNEPLKFQ